MSLNSRLGFHFSILEAFISERTTENYINLQFKGGAADIDRRLKRILFIRDILVQYDFSVNGREDTLFARTENRNVEYVIGRPKLLGYLMLHTRQLDMIMTSPDLIYNFFAFAITHFP